MTAEAVDDNAAAEAQAEVGRLIRAAREERGWSQAELAKRLNRTQTAISYWESGAREIGVWDLILTAQALGVPAASLMPPGSVSPHQLLAERAARRASETALDAVALMGQGRHAEATDRIREAAAHLQTALGRVMSIGCGGGAQ